MKKVLIIPNTQSSSELVNYLKNMDYSPIILDTYDEGLKKINKSKDIKVVLLNVESSGRNGLQTLKQIKHKHPKVSVLLIGAGVQTARKGMLLKASDVLPESTDVERIYEVLESVFKRQSIREKASEFIRHIYEEALDRAFNRPSTQNETTPMSDEDEAGFKNEYSLENKFFLVGDHRSMFNVNKAIGSVADSKVSVWLEGETGTGKGLAARLIHEDSDRAEKPFVTIDCGAVPGTIFESELFGHKKGAFTDAVSDKIGKFEEADGGVLFLDEVGNMPRSQQMKLLNVLQTGEFTRVGETQVRSADVRVISATNQNLKDMMDQGEFRQDLYQRLCVYKISLPPLRERKEDILSLVSNALRRYEKENNKPKYSISEEVTQLLCKYNWPGNVRELENCLKAAIVNSQDDVILLNDLPPDFQKGSSNDDSNGNEQEMQSTDTLVTPVYENLFDLPVVVFCQLIADAESGVPDQWWNRFSDDGLERVAKARLEIENWKLEWNTTWLELSDLSERIKKVVDGAIAQISQQHQTAAKPIEEAEPITIEGRTHRGSLTAVLHQVVKAHGYDREKAANELDMPLKQLEKRLSYIVNEEGYEGDREKAAEALHIRVNQLEAWISEWTKDDSDDRKNALRTSIEPSHKSRQTPFPGKEIRRLLTKSVISFVLDTFSRVEWRDKSLEGQIRTVHLALKVLSKRLNKDHGYIYFGGMTFSQIERSIYRRAPYLYKTPKIARKALNVDIRTLRNHWPKDKEWPWVGGSLSHDTLFIG